ncbi:DUF4157 domain-containing protein [Paucibacter sp. APW11]|uniref:DUF4157 domain-containing protein n=1 Tax=Roseateles aquae TaxID=3077235 RepID=A0ABU3PA35_9BURK|nr:DUF4157 domain-containing protein [Paucibacter sp. APW11]MDT8999142.1 DUF4157 domain-containing protein [Paucibacter sp. APW11]
MSTARGARGSASSRAQGGTAAHGKALAAAQRPAVTTLRSAPSGGAEQQAERAADAFLRGEQGLAGGLSPAPWSAFKLSQSLGEALPATLAQPLGAAFGVDLDGLRIHRDAVAQQAAQRLGARAFAAGRDVYFANAAFDTASAAGRHLIAHEVAHVIQQAGVRASGGGWRLEARANGLGAVQCQPASTAPPPAQDAAAAFDDMVRRTTSSSEGEHARAAIEMARQALAAAPDRHGRIADGTLAQPIAWGSPLVDATRQSAFIALHPVGKGFIVDCLKRLGYWARAKEILQADTRFQIRIGRWNQDFAAWLANGDAAVNWIGTALATAEFRDIWPVAAMNQYRRFLLRPHTAPLPLPASVANAHQDATQRLNTALHEHRLVPQEGVVLAWQLLDSLHAEQFTHLQELQAEHGVISSQTTPLHQRVTLLSNLRRDWQAKLDAADTPAHLRQYAQALLALIDELLPFWQECLGLFESTAARFTGLDDRDLVAPLPLGEAAPLTLPLVRALHDALLPAWQQLFAMGDDGQLPSSEVYARALDAFEQALAVDAPAPAHKTLLERIDAALVDEFDRTRAPAMRPGARARPAPDRSRLRTLVTLAFWLDFLRTQTRRYNRTVDDASPHFVDERAGHRVRMARHVGALARWLRWADVLASCEPVLAADRSAAGALWLLSDWEPDAVLSIGRLAEDFPENLDRPFPGTPFTARHLVDWFRLDYNTRLADTLDTLLRAEARLPADDQLDLSALGSLVHQRGAVGEVIGGAEAQFSAAGGEAPAPASGSGMGLTQPQRFVVRDWVASLNPEAELDWSGLIASRPKTRLQLERHLDIASGPGATAERADLAAHGPLGTLRIIYPVPPTMGVFAWVLPSLVPMVRFLAGLREPRNASLAAELAWLRERDPLTMSPDDWNRFNTRIRELLERPLHSLQEALPDRLRRLTALLRRLATRRLRARMDRFIAGPGMESGDEMRLRLTTPQWAVDQVEDLRAMAYPRDEAELQMGLLMLSLAPQVLAFAQRPLDAASFNQAVYGDLIATLAILDDRERFQAMRRCATHSEDEAGNIVYIDSRLRERSEQLRQAKAAMDAAVLETQGQVGFRGDAAQGSSGTITPLGLSTPIYANTDASQADTWRLGMRADADGHIDWATGTRYQIHSVAHSFTYYQGIGAPTPAGMRAGAGGAYAPARLVFPEGSQRPENGEPRLLFTLLIDGVATPVTEDNLELLTRLNDVFLWRSFGIGMENTAAMSQAAMQWIITVVGIAQPELAYAELATNLIAMAAGGEFDELVHQLYQDPLGLVGDIVTRFAGNALRADHLWRFLILNSDANPLALLGSLVPSRPRAQSHPATTRLGRIVAALRDIGQRFAAAVEQLKLRTAGPLRSAQSTISLRPRLAWLLLRAADFIGFVADQVPPSVRDRLINGVVELASGEVAGGADADEGVLATLVAIVREQISSSADDMEQSTRRLLEGLATYELPAELIDLELATELIMQFILDRFGPRGRAYRLIMELFPIPQEDRGRFQNMDTLYHWVCAQIAGAWRGTELDPNRYWRQDVLPQIAGRFDQTRDELVDMLYDASDFVLSGLGRPHFPRPAGLAPTVIDPVPLDPATQGGPAGSVHRSPGWHLPLSAGRPLEPEIRTDLEGRFGVQLRHVRMHDGDEGRRATEPIGARAVTSGSHIYRHPDEAGDGAAAQRLLAHEVAHVVQQMGPRAHAPGFGRPGAGLILDVAAERRADAAAARALGGAPAAAATAGSASPGVQPAFETVVARDILNLLSTTGSTTAFEVPTGGVEVPGIAQARAIWSSVHTRLGAPSQISFAAFMQETEVQAALQALLSNTTHVAQVERDLAGIANLAQRPLPRARRSARISTELDPARFVTLLEGYLFAAFGVAMQISAAAPAFEVSALNVTNVDLGRVASDNELWNKAMRTLPDAGGVYRRELHARLGVMGPSRVPQPGMFESTRFAFSSAFVEDFRSLQNARNTAAVTALETAANYKATGRSDVRGLRLATHGELKSRGVSEQKRESHHMSQYLLAQFFANVHERKFIPPALRDAVNDGVGPAGIVWDGAMVAELGLGGRRLRLTAMDVTSSERGANMPAILLASRTHKRGRLHIEREGQWDADRNETTGTLSQGNAIRNAFNAALPADLRTDTATPAQAARIRAWYAAPANIGKGPQPYYDAAVATYHWMYSRMIPALETALQTEERAFYNGVAAIGHPGDSHYQLSEGEMSTVFNDAKRYHDTRMRTAFGWPTP